jgi:hypothetical protein
MEASPIRRPRAPVSCRHIYTPYPRHPHDGYPDILIMTSHASFRCPGSRTDSLYAIVNRASANERATELPNHFMSLNYFTHGFFNDDFIITKFYSNEL